MAFDQHTQSVVPGFLACEESEMALAVPGFSAVRPMPLQVVAEGDDTVGWPAARPPYRKRAKHERKTVPSREIALPAGAEMFRPYEKYVARLRAPEALKSVGVDDDDVQAEARIAVWRAVSAWRARDGAEPGGIDELRWVRRSIKNAVLTKIRYANYERRKALDQEARASIQTEVYGTHLAAAFGHAAEEVETPAEEADRKERELSIQRAADKVRESLGAPRYAKLLEFADRRWRDPPDLSALRGIFGLSLERMEDAMGTAPEQKERPPVQVSDLTDDELGRVCLVHNQKVPAFVRPQLLKIVTNLNNSEPFPPCFRIAEEYNPDFKDEAGNYPCRDECDFRQECRANIPAFANPVIEQGLVLLKAPPVQEKPEKPAAKEVKKPEANGVDKAAQTSASAPEAPVNKPKRNKKASVEAPLDRPKADFTPVAEVGPAPAVAVGQVYVDLDPRTKGKRFVVVTETAPSKATIVNIEGKPSSRLPYNKLDVVSPKKGFALVGENDPKIAFAPEKLEEQGDPSKPAAKQGKASKPAKAAKVPAQKGNGAKSNGAKSNGAKSNGAKSNGAKSNGNGPPIEGVFFSSRRGVLPAGQRGYSKDEQGKRFYRLPQGSAGYMRTCPIGTTAEREWKGSIYKVKKIAGEGTNSVWRLVSKDGNAYAKPLEDTLGKITFHVTKNTAWSAAKFWNLLPPELKKDSGKFDPSAAASKYRVYGVGKDEQAGA